MAAASVEKVEHPQSRADRFAAAEADFDTAKSEIESLRDELQEWRDGLPENLQGGSKAGELDDAIAALEEVLDSMESVCFESLSFPGMY